MREVAQRLELDAGDVEAVSNLIVPFYLAHRWLRVRGAPSSHHPDSVHNIKARQLVKIAFVQSGQRWRNSLAEPAPGR